MILATVDGAVSQPNRANPNYLFEISSKSLALISNFKLIIFLPECAQ